MLLYIVFKISHFILTVTCKEHNYIIIYSLARGYVHFKLRSSKPKIVTYKMVQSSFWGDINEIPGIFVDNFENPEKKQAKIYFLSHAHTDHTVGLYDDVLRTYLRKQNVFIYTSEATAAIINYESKGLLEHFIKPLKLGTTTLPLKNDSDSRTGVSLEVTLLPAGHCFGSVMFLFKTQYKTVLYTGDFRTNCNDVSKYSQLHENGRTVKIDTMYVDTTFHSEMYSHFPKRSTCIEGLVTMITKWLETKGNKVALHTSAKYGYEFVFNEIYEKLNEKVYVNNAKWDFYRTVANLVPGLTNDLANSKIHVCTNRTENFKHSKCIDDDTSDFLFIHFSAMVWEGYGNLENPLQRLSPKRINVCFPTHCSNEELLFFINYLRPNKIVGFPNEYKAASKSLEVKFVPKKRSLKRLRKDI